MEIQADGASIGDPGDGLWLRVSRLADAGIVLSEYSLDGSNWIAAHGQAMTFQDSIAYGLAITNHLDNELLAEATVSDVQLVDAVTAAGLRSLSIEDPVYVAGDPITVTIAVGGGSGELTVTETPPAGWTVSDVSDGGTESGGTITWSLSSAATVSYVVTPPGGASEDVTFNGAIGDVTIFGDNSLTAPQPIGIFDHHLDIGAVGAPGDAEYIEDDDSYWVTGSGADIWGSADQFHYVYKKTSGAFRIEGVILAYNDSGSNEWSKAGFMVRDNLTAGSPHFQAIFRGSDGQYDTQWRAEQDASSFNTGLKSDVTGDVRLERSGNTFQAYYMNTNGDWILDTAQTITMTDPIYLGLSVTSHENPNYAAADYFDLNLTLFPFNVMKEASDEEINPGGSVDVVMTVDVREGESPDIVIQESYSDGATLSNISADAGEWTDDQSGTLSWNLSGAAGKISLKYTVSIAADYKDSFVELSGSFDDGAGYTGSTGTTTLLVVAEDLGIFQGHQDIGSPGAPGNVSVDGDAYQVIGSGHDIWDAADDFHYLWMRVSGDFTFSIDDPYIGAYGSNPSSNDWQKMGIMARQELTASSPYVYGCVRSSDQALMIQWRETDGGDAAWTDASQIGPSEWNPNYDPALSDGVNNPSLDEVSLGGTIKMTREADLFTLWYVYDNEDWYQNEFELAMTDPIYLGIAVTSHTTGATSQGIFKNPQVEGTIVNVKSWMLY
ncbi:MAG: hypothetical protein JXR73_01060 [Candidatus Omnitrophica bacterium]|nr:hypothetical protein [Candidatus Omnitrophota bacterium]